MRRKDYNAKLTRERARALKREKPHLTNTAIASRLKVSPNTVRNYTLDLVDVRECRHWTNTEVSELAAFIGIIPPILLANKFKRTEQSVRMKAKELRLSISTIPKVLSDARSAEVVGVTIDAVQYWVVSGLLKARLKNNSRREIKVQNLAEFCRNHPELVAHLNSPILDWLRKEAGTV